MILPGATVIARPDLPRGPYRNTTTPAKGLLHGVEAPPWTDLTHAARTHPNPPHVWFAPDVDVDGQLIQNFDTRVAARALMSPNNNDQVVQFELALFSESDPDTDPARGPEDWLDEWLERLARRIIVPTSVEHGIPLVYPDFLPYPASYGASSVRFSRARWLAWSGWCGHQHSPAPDDHGDPGALDVPRALDIARDLMTPPSPVPPPSPALYAAWFASQEA